jgi:mediator of RNA polymerase II transcription subunit 12
VDPVAYFLLVDTLYYLLDGELILSPTSALSYLTSLAEIPSDTKTTTFDPFRNYPQIPLSELSPDMPLENREQLRSLLPWPRPNPIVSNLVNAYRDPSGKLAYGAPVLNRPWEWIENLGEPSVVDPKEGDRDREEKERRKTKYLVKNTGSLSLDTFGARVTGDGVIWRGEDGRVEGNIRSFEDGLSADSIFKRDWRETRVELHDAGLLSGGRTKGEGDDEAGCLPVFANQGRSEKKSTPRVSPAPSRASTTASGSLRQSPPQLSLNRLSVSTAGEFVDIDSNATTGSMTTRASKRKPPSVSDDEIEIIEGPIPAPLKTTKKPKPKASTRPRGKKR